MYQSFLQIYPKFHDRTAFVINQKAYSYREFAQKISNIRAVLRAYNPNEQVFVGIFTDDDLETYAAVYALWLSGFAAVPLSPDFPKERIANILEQSEAKLVLTTQAQTFSDLLDNPSIRILNTQNLADVNIDLTPVNFSEQNPAYLLFTSGSTGVPKGVALSHHNLETFCDSFYSAGNLVDENDRFLQMFDLSFDYSVLCFGIPLANGGSVYTVPRNVPVKYAYVYELLEEQALTFVAVVPSLLSYLRPYFSEIRLEKLRYLHLSGEALKSDLIEEFAVCIPNAKIQNLYGNSEASIYTTVYDWNLDKNQEKSYNGIVTIGKPLKNMIALVFDETYTRIVGQGEKGEICLAGDHVMQEYLKAPEKNAQAFFEYEYLGKIYRFFKTGDLAFYDKDGDMMYCGRKDHQVKVQGGYRVELNEVEHYAKEVFNSPNVVAVAYTNEMNISQIYLFVENFGLELTSYYKVLEQKIPAYMLPKEILNIPKFPLNNNGKIDRKRLQEDLKLLLKK